MSKFTLERRRIDLRRGNVVELEVREPGIIRFVYCDAEQESLILARPGQQPEVTVFPFFAIEVDPDAPKRKRRFVATTVNLVIDTAQLGAEALVYIGTIIDPQRGAPVAFYEAPIVAADELAIAPPLARNGVGPE